MLYYRTDKSQMIETNQVMRLITLVRITRGGDLCSTNLTLEYTLRFVSLLIKPPISYGTSSLFWLTHGLGEHFVH